MATKKKITKVEGTPKNTDTGSRQPWSPTESNASKASQYRVIAFILWLVAIGLQMLAIFKFLNPVNMTWLIVILVVNLGLAVTANFLWKKANRLDPASEKNKFKFFIQNQLGAIMSVLAFLPLIILIFLDKDMSGKQKGIAGTIGIVALLIAGYTGIDFNPPSVEQYTEQTQMVEDLMGQNNVFWTKSGRSFHLFNDCHHINRDVTKEIFEGTVADARELKNITDLCNTCANRAKKLKLEEGENLLQNNEVEELLEAF